MQPYEPYDCHDWQLGPYDAIKLRHSKPGAKQHRYEWPVFTDKRRLMTAMERDALWPQLAYSVEKLRFQSRQKNYRPLGASLHFGRGGTRDFILRATKSLLIAPLAIHRPN